MGEIFRQQHSATAASEPAEARIFRLHRYYLARGMAAGAEVIDLNGGDGSGAALLAGVARTVLAGLDDAAALDAAEADFPRCGAGFRLRAELDAQEDISGDLVLAFDTLARAADPAACIAALRRKVRQGGRLLLDAPAPDAAGLAARRVFTAAELAALLGEHFAHVRVLSQAGLVGSAMEPAGGPATQPGHSSTATATAVFSHPDRVHARATAGLPRADSLLAVAADTPLDDVGRSLLIDAPLAALAEARARALQATTEARTLKDAQAALIAQLQDKRRTDSDWRHQLAVLRVNEAAAQSRATALLAERETLMRTTLQLIEDRTASEHQAARTAEERDALRREVDELRAARRALEAQHADLLAEYAVVKQGMEAGPILRLRRAAGRALARLPTANSRLRAIRSSPCFDAAWYRQRYIDVLASGIEPARHYLDHGNAENRAPSAGFDAGWYAVQHPDLASSGLTAVEHYDRFGRAAAWPTTPPPEPARAAAPAPPPPPPANPKILFIAGEADTPGAQYRCVRYAEAAIAAGYSAGWSRVECTGGRELVGVEVAVLWRVRWSPHVAGVVREVRNAGGTVVFDVDDLMIRPELARTSVIDGIRTGNSGITSAREIFEQVRQTMTQADLCTTTTEELARHMRDWQKATYVLPNGFDHATHARSRLALRQRAAQPRDGLVRIGYAAGSVTHQRDFAQALPGLLRLFAARANTRLILFRARGESGGVDTDLVVVDEFDQLAAFADRIEWRDMVTLDGLAAELARFDINIAPLEVGNPFCEAKSELKVFEAALVNVPTVASPTGPFARCIRHGHTGMLAETDEDWFEALLRLTDDAVFRGDMGRRAYLACLWPFGPQRRSELVDGFLRQIQGSKAGARIFALEAARGQTTPPLSPAVLQPAQLLFHADTLAENGARVTVIVPCYNYADFIIDALESVRLQTLDPLDLVVVDDCSPDPLATDLIVQWAQTHQGRFNRILVLRHIENAGLSVARNTGFEAAETPYVLPLDADNRLLPDCAERLLAAVDGTDIAFAYSSVRMFGAADSVFCNERYQPARFIGGNYIDAMAMIAKWAWAAAGGYDMPRNMGWEDFDLWCKLAELAQRGLHVNHVLAEYRVHGGSMIATVVEIDENKEKMVAEIERRHPWLQLSSRRKYERI